MGWPEECLGRGWCTGLHCSLAVRKRYWWPFSQEPGPALTDSLHCAGVQVCRGAVGADLVTVARRHINACLGTGNVDRVSVSLCRCCSSCSCSCCCLLLLLLLLPVDAAAAACCCCCCCCCSSQLPKQPPSSEITQSPNPHSSNRPSLRAPPRPGKGPVAGGAPGGRRRGQPRPARPLLPVDRGDARAAVARRGKGRASAWLPGDCD